MIQNSCFPELLSIGSMSSSQVVSMFSLRVAVELGTDTCRDALWSGRWENHALTGLHQDLEIIWIPRKAKPHWSAPSTALNPASSTAETACFIQKHGPWEPTLYIIIEQLFQTWHIYAQLPFPTEEGHSSLCHILNCNHYILGEEKAEISYSLQFSLGRSAVRNARAMGKKRSRQEGE